MPYIASTTYDTGIDKGMIKKGKSNNCCDKHQGSHKKNSLCLFLNVYQSDISAFRKLFNNHTM